MLKWVPQAILILGCALILRSVFPKKERVIVPPRITTVHDTVTKIDTTWITKVKKEIVHDTVNLIEKVTVTVPETVTVAPKLSGLTFLHVGEKVGDSTLAAGFSLAPNDSAKSYLFRDWQIQAWTAGPLRTFEVDLSTLHPRVTFYKPDQYLHDQCGLFCKARHYLLGGAVGWASCKAGVL